MKASEAPHQLMTDGDAAPPLSASARDTGGGRVGGEGGQRGRGGAMGWVGGQRKWGRSHGVGWMWTKGKGRSQGWVGG